MFTIKADPKNRQVQIITRNMPQMGKAARRKAFYHIGKDLVTESRRLIDLPKTGRLYKIRKGNRLRDHRASAPGEAPAKVTGNLRASVDFLVRGGSQMEFGSLRKIKRRIAMQGVGFKARGNVLRTLNYPRYLEEGTTKMAARPFLMSSIKNNYRNSVNRFKIEFEKELARKARIL